MSIIENIAPDQVEQIDSIEESASPVAQVVQIDPNALVVEENIRRQVNLPRAFVNSVKLHGVIVPILAHPDTDGNIVVRDGQRRTLAAREAGLATVPAYIVDADDATTVRIVQQIIANEHREGLTNVDRATAWRQLALEGMSVTAIAKQTGTRREEVKTGLAVAEHEVATAAVAEYDLTLDQALVLIEFEDDPDTLAELREVARKNPDSFDHHAQRKVDEKAARERVAALRADYQAKGYTVVDWPAWDDTSTLALRDLQNADGERLTEENYAGKPGHAVAIGERWGSVSVGHVVVGWKEHGLRKYGSTGPGAGGRMTEEEKATRRTLIANNKAWVSAEKVRRAWLTRFLGRKRLPSDALPFAAVTLASERYAVASAAQDGHSLAETLLGYERASGKNPLADLPATTPTKAGHVVLAIALAALEATTDKSTWRNPSQSDRRYLSQLAAWGYTLSDVERIVTGEEPDDPDEATAEADPAPTEEEVTEVTTDTTAPEAAEEEAEADEPEFQEPAAETDEATDPGVTEPEADSAETEPEVGEGAENEAEDRDGHLTAA